MPLSVCPTFCCLVAAVACLHPRPTSGEDAPPTPVQRLLTALQASQKARAILSLDARTRTLHEGREKSHARISALIPLDGSESFAVLGCTPHHECDPTPGVESNLSTTFNGRYWALATYDRGPAGSMLRAEKTLHISRKAPQVFRDYLHATALSLCLPFVRLQRPEGTISLQQLLEGRSTSKWAVTEEQRGDARVLRLSIPPAEWLIIDPAKPFVVLEHVVEHADGREETLARKVGLTSCGLWFATDHVYIHTKKNQEVLRIETRLDEVTFAEKSEVEKRMQPGFGRGWRVLDERSQEEYEIEDNAMEVFEKLDAVVH